VTRFDATFVYRRRVAAAITAYRTDCRTACRLARAKTGARFVLSGTCRNDMGLAELALDHRLYAAGVFLNTHPVVLS
jgi:hypothetical protein